MATAGSIVVDLLAKTSSFETDLQRASRTADREAKRISQSAKQHAQETERAWSGASRAITAALGAVSVGAIFTRLTQNTINAANEQAQLAAVLRSTGEAAGWSATQLNELAARISRASTVSAGEINQAQTTLLAFTGIVGDQFTKALQAAVDMAARTGMSVVSAAETIGRALDIPSQGLAALSRQGFRFTDDQKKLAEQLESTGRTAEAQQIILSALTESYGGAAEAARNTLGGALAGLVNSFDDLLTGSERAFTPIVAGIESINDLLASGHAETALQALSVAVLGVSAVFAGRLVGSVTASAMAFGAATVEASRYQMTLARMAGVSSAAAAGIGAMSVATRAASGLMAVMGGPVGLIATIGLTAAGFIAMGGSARTASVDIDGLSSSLGTLNERQLSLRRLELEADVEDLERKATESHQILTGLQNDVAELNRMAAEGYNITSRELDNAVRAILEEEEAYNKTSNELDKKRTLLDQVVGRLQNLNSAAHGAAGGVSALNQAMLSDAGVKYLAQIQGRIKALQDGGDPIKIASRHIAEHADLTDADRVAIMSAAHAEKALQDARDKAIASTRTSTKSLSDAQKAAQAFRREQEQSLAAQYQSISAIHEQAQGIEDQVAYFGMSKTALEDLTIARLEEQAAVLRGFTGSQGQVEAIEREIDARKRLRAAMGSLEAREEARRVNEQTAAEWKRTTEQMGQSLTDALLRGFESGKSFAENFRDTLKNMFRTLVLQPIIQPLMNGVAGSIQSALGMGPGGGSNMFGLAQSANSLHSALSGGLTNSLSNGIGWVGEKLGSTALQSFAQGMTGMAATWGQSFAMSALPATASWAGAAAGLTSAAVPSLTGLTVAPSVAASLGTTVGTSVAGAASGAAGMGAAFSAALPWIGGGLALASLLGGDLLGGWDGEDRFGNVFTYQGGSTTPGSWAGDPGGEVNAAGTQMVQAAVDAINSAFAGVGSSAFVSKFYGEMETSEKDRGGVNSGGYLSGVRGLGIPAEIAAAMDERDRPYWHQITDAGGAWFGTHMRGEGHGPDSGTLEEMAQYLQTDLMQTVIQAWQLGIDEFPSIVQDMIRGIDADSLSLEQASAVVQQVQAVIAEVQAFQQAVEQLPFASLRDLSFDAAAGLVSLAGGVENLLGAQQTYYENFYSEAERHEHAIGNLTSALSAAGVEMPALVGSADEMRAAYRSLVEAQDLETEAGRQAYVVLMGAAGAFSEVATYAGQASVAVDEVAVAVRSAADILRERQGLETQLLQLQGNTAELRRRELDALDESNRGLQQRIWALQDETIAYQRSVDAYNEAVAETNAAWATVQSVAQREIAQLQTTFAQTDSVYKALARSIDVQRTALNQQMRASEQMVSTLRGTVDLIGTNVRELRSMTTETAAMQYQAAMEVIRQAAGGALPERDRLSEAIQAARGVAEDPDQYASAFERDFAMLTLANELERVQQAAEPQLSVQEQALEVAREQLSKMDAALAAAQSQINHLRGIDDKTYEQTLETIKLQLAGQDQLDKLSDIDINTYVTEKLTQELLKAQANEEAARKQIDGINSQLSLAQQQLDQLRGLNTTGMSMISALNNLADAMAAERIATPPSPPSTTAPTVPTDPYAKGNRTYMPANYADAMDYALANTDVFSSWLTHSKTLGAMTPEQSKSAMTNFMQQHWRNYGQFEGRKFADGGYYPGGLALVGEKGPELINFARPGQVYTADQTQDILRNMGRGNYSGILQSILAENKALRAENKAHAQAIVQLNTQIMRILRQWDGNGIPETRELVEA